MSEPCVHEKASPEPAADLVVFYGGTFDPVHCGHLEVARQARDRLQTTILLMPAADPPHRPAPGATALQRAQMLDLAVAGERGLKVDRRELLRNTPSYSIDTLHGIRGELGPDAPVALLIGADGLLDLPQWKAWQALFSLAHFVVAERPGIDLDGRLPEPLPSFLKTRWTHSVEDLRTAAAGRVLRLQQPLHPQSATNVRRNIAEGRSWRSLVPTAVAGYIDRHKLYAAGAGAPASL
ncbi:MAG: nicotinate-nucleotide adenylyltransferase [Lysobacter sp.]